MGLHNTVRFDVQCPRCGEPTEAAADFKAGLLDCHTYRVGERVIFDGVGEVVDALHGAAAWEVEGYAECGVCHRDFWVLVELVEDRIAAVTLNSKKEPYISDDGRSSDGRQFVWRDGAGWVEGAP